MTAHARPEMTSSAVSRCTRPPSAITHCATSFVHVYCSLQGIARNMRVSGRTNSLLDCSIAWSKPIEQLLVLSLFSAATALVMLVQQLSQDHQVDPRTAAELHTANTSIILDIRANSTLTRHFSSSASHISSSAGTVCSNTARLALAQTTLPGEIILKNTHRAISWQPLVRMKERKRQALVSAYVTPSEPRTPSSTTAHLYD